jgi:hypothetical protein
LVPPSDVDSDQSHYSPTGSAYALSDGITEYECSEEEGQAMKKLATKMMEQPVDDELPFKKSKIKPRKRLETWMSNQWRENLLLIMNQSLETLHMSQNQ